MGWTGFLGGSLAALAAVIGVAALALALDGHDRLERIDRTPPIGELTEHPGEWLGAVVTVEGSVGEIFHLRPLDGRPVQERERPAGVAFTLLGDDGRLLVVSADDPEFMNLDSHVQVQGRLMEFDPGVFSTGFGLDLRGDPYRPFEDEPALIARIIEPALTRT